MKNKINMPFMKRFFKSQNQINTLLSLRGVAIVIQLIIVLLVSQGLGYQLPVFALLSVIGFEVLFTVSCYFYYGNKPKTTQLSLFKQVLADVLFLSLLLYFSGGATNAFVSLLLIPIAIAAVTLPLWMLAITAIFSVASYSFMLWLMPMHVIHGNMQGHFIGMWVNFLFSTLVVSLVVTKLARAINEKERAIAKYREKQLKQEKLVALGIASAQVTHQLATPLATALLLVDELKEEYSEDDVVIDIQTQLQRCSDSLHNFRQQTFDIKNQVAKTIFINDIVEQIQQHTLLNYPDINLEVVNDNKTNASVLVDGAFLPAIFNLINNGVRASKMNKSNKLVLSVGVNKNKLLLTIKDFGTGFTDSKLTKLGLELVESDEGLGMAVFLSHASLERLGGKLTLSNHQQGGALVSLLLPLDNSSKDNTNNA